VRAVWGGVRALIRRRAWIVLLRKGRLAAVPFDDGAMRSR
jgi:hypothetical protein